MNYQVNLYRPELLPKPVPLAFTSIAGLWALVLVVLLLVGIQQQWKLHTYRNAFVLAQSEQSKLNHQLEDYNLRYPPVAIDMALQAMVDTREQEFSSKNMMLNMLVSKQNKSTRGFSRFLVGFSRQHLPGLWLQEIQVNRHSQLSLTGNVTAPDILPRYLEKLTSDVVFNGQKFRLFKMMQPELTSSSPKNSIANTLHFELKSEIDDAENLLGVVQ